MGFHQEISKGAKFVPRAGGGGGGAGILASGCPHCCKKLLRACSLVREEGFRATGSDKLQ